MGHYTTLYVDRLKMEWKNYIPAFLTFLFQPDDLYINYDADKDLEHEEDDEEETDQGYSPEITGIGYKTTCGNGINTLDSFGFSLDFVTEVYRGFAGDLDAQYRSIVEDALVDRARGRLDDEPDILKARYLSHVSRFGTLAPEEEVRDFVRFLREFVRADFLTPPFSEPYRLREPGSKRYQAIDAKQYLTDWGRAGDGCFDFESLQMYLLDKSLKFPPWIMKLSALLDEDYRFEYPEVISLVFLRLALECANPDTELHLDLYDVVEDEEEARNLHTTQIQSLVDKVNLYNRVFRNLFVDDAKIRDRYVKAKCAELLKLCSEAQNEFEKGRSLEQLMEVLFTAHESFKVVDKNLSTGDEEIDLVLKNNVDRPFWISLNSPLIFVECKNWSSPVEAKEIRDFEIKVQNHAPLVRLGMFVATNGFSKGAREEQKRMGRSNYHLAFFDSKDIEDFVRSGTGLFEWLEEQVTRLQ